MSLYSPPTASSPPVFLFAFPSLFLITAHSWDGPLPGITYFSFACQAAVSQLPFWKQLSPFSIPAFPSRRPWSRTAGLRLLWGGRLLGVLSLSHPRAAPASKFELTLSWPWAGLGLAWGYLGLVLGWLFIYRLVSRAIGAFVAAILTSGGIPPKAS